MTLRSYKSAYLNNFGGHPRRTITSIDVSGGIVCSGTSGKVPCFIQASASAILASGTTRPYEDLEYVWDFGDAGSVETFTNPGVGGGTVNSNNQRGPEAVHCYRVPGTYTITLTIRGARLPFLIKTTVTQVVTISAFVASGGEYWADSAAGGTNAGTEANPFNTIAAINTAIASGDNKQLHVKRDSVFIGTTGLLLWNTGTALGNSGLRIDAYGSGAKPIFEISSGSNYPLRMTNGGSSSPRPKADVVISNLRNVVSGTATTTSTFSIFAGTPPTAAFENIYLDNCEGHLAADNANGRSFEMGDLQASKMGMWNCVATCDQVRTHSTMGFLGSCASWFFIYGGSFEGGTDAEVFDHHIYPSVQYHSVYRWIDFKSGPLRNYCINLNWGNHDLPIDYAEFVLIADCNATGTDRFHDLSQVNDFSNIGSLFRNVVVERNRVHDMPQNGAIFFYSAETYTNRDNEVWGLDGAYYAPSIEQATHLSSSLYRNKIHRDSNVIADDTIVMGNAAWILRHEIFDNIIVDMRTSARISAFPYANLFAVDGNQYYAPNDLNSKFLRDVTTDKTFAEQRAAGFDLNGSVADPGWTDAANGDFS